jgi:trehalose 6-phosphate phosphatase
VTTPEDEAAWREARTRMLALLATPGRLLVVTDFDGTLAPITMEPMGARIEPIGRRAVRRLAALSERRPDRLTVVVLSGRLAADVAGRVRVGGVRYLGNHGIEGGSLARGRRAEALQVSVEPSLEPYLEPSRAIADAVVVALGRPDWLFVELKGPTVAFHFRQAPDSEAAELAVIEAIDAAQAALGGTGLMKVGGRRIVELRPQVAGGKGAALERLLEQEHPGAVLALGDDVSDAEAFDALRAARERGEVAGLAVGVHGAQETPAAVREAADVELAAPRDAARLLSALASALEREERQERQERQVERAQDRA